MRTTFSLPFDSMTALREVGRSHCGSVLLGDRGVKGEVGVEESWYGRSREGLREVMITLCKCDCSNGPVSIFKVAYCTL